MKTSTIALTVLLVLAAVYMVYQGGKFIGVEKPTGEKAPSGKYDDFAKCLTEKGAVFYGASWCPHCNEQKEMFGDSMQYVKYVECASDDGGQTEACSQKKITGYPTWEINGELSPGKQSFEELSSKTGCALP